MDYWFPGLAYFLIFGSVYALAWWCGPRCKSSGGVASKVLDPVFVFIPGEEPNQVMVPMPREGATQPDLLQPTIENADSPISQVAEEEVDPPEIPAQEEVPLVAVSLVPSLEPESPKPEEEPASVASPMPLEKANLSVSPVPVQSPCNPTEAEILALMAPQAFVEAVGLLKQKGMEGEALDLEQEIIVGEVNRFQHADQKG